MLSILILAAGKGKRMNSRLPKVLHQIAGKSLLEHIINTCKEISNHSSINIIIGHQAEKIQNQLSHLEVTWIQQEQQLGTGHAALQALPNIKKDHQVLILYGDTPLISMESLTQLINQTPANSLGIMTTHLSNPRGLGRVIRDKEDNVIGIVEEKDASEIEKEIKEINSGIYLIPASYLHKWLPQITNNNQQKEYYLTDMISMAVSDKVSIHTCPPKFSEEVIGINDQYQLALAERFYQKRHVEMLLHQGVTFLDPSRFDLRGSLQVGRDVVIDINVIIEGNVTIGNNCTIGANTILKDCKLGDNTSIRPYTYIDGSEIHPNATIGPYARLRPGSIIEPYAHIGNFVEVKNSHVGTETKINHLSYIGDSEIGKQVNIGAGTITCNFDGVRKHKTIIKDNAFIGSNTELVAPIVIGESATIGAGSTITKDAPPNQLTLSRVRQSTISQWKKPT